MNKPNVTKIINSLRNPAKALLGRISPVLSLQAENLKLLGGFAVAIPLLVWLFITFSGSSDPLTTNSLVIGKIYRLNNPNSGALVLNAAPSLTATASYKGKETGDTGCMVNPGTRATFIEKTFVSYIIYAKMKPVEGKCKGRTGWTSIVNVQNEIE